METLSALRPLCEGGGGGGGGGGVGVGGWGWGGGVGGAPVYPHRKEEQYGTMSVHLLLIVVRLLFELLNNGIVADLKHYNAHRLSLK